MRKKWIWIAASLLLCACTGSTTATDRESTKKNVTVTTSFLQDMVEVLAGDAVTISLIIPAGEDPHTYEAKPEDNAKLQQADLILYHGLHFEGKMTDLLRAVDAVAVTKDFDTAAIGEMEEHGEKVIDPHFWFDTGLYKQACSTAAAALVELLPEKKETIEKNLHAYHAELDELDRYIKEQLALIPEGQRILVTPHDAFHYFSRCYHMQVKAPQGVSTDAELSNRDMAETAEFIVQHQIKAIFAESTTDPARMEKLRESCLAKGFDVKIVRGQDQELFSDSLAPKGQKGDTYITMYRFDVDLIVSNLK